MTTNLIIFFNLTIGHNIGEYYNVPEKIGTFAV